MAVRVSAHLGVWLAWRWSRCVVGLWLAVVFGYELCFGVKDNLNAKTEPHVPLPHATQATQDNQLACGPLPAACTPCVAKALLSLSSCG